MKKTCVLGKTIYVPYALPHEFCLASLTTNPYEGQSGDTFSVNMRFIVHLLVMCRRAPINHCGSKNFLRAVAFLYVRACHTFVWSERVKRTRISIGLGLCCEECLLGVLCSVS